jgi:hypothetical protein
MTCITLSKCHVEKVLDRSECPKRVCEACVSGPGVNEMSCPELTYTPQPLESRTIDDRLLKERQVHIAVDRVSNDLSGR